MELTTNEVAALFNVDERRLRKEVEHGVLGASSPPRFEIADVVYLRTVDQIGVRVTSIEDRRNLHARIREALGAASTFRLIVRLSAIAELNLDAVLVEVQGRVERFCAWKAGLTTSPDVLGGEPVIPGTRLAVRQIGGMLLRGADVDEVRQDYPYLSEDDLAFARVYAKAYPPLGRPRDRRATAR